MNVRHQATVIFLGISLISCGGGSPIDPSEAGITRTAWKLHSIQQTGTDRLDIHNPERFTLTLGDDQRASVRADCNVCTGSFELAGQTLQLGLMACTRAFCGAESADTQFLKALEGSLIISNANGALTVASRDTVMKFEQ